MTVFHPKVLPVGARGGSKIFSKREGAGFQKYSKILSTFFLDRPNVFLSFPKSIKDPILTKIFCAAGKFLKNRPKKAFFGTYWKMLTKK